MYRLIWPPQMENSKEIAPMTTPRVPMIAQHLPQQRLYMIKIIPAIPVGLPLEVGYDLPTNLKRPPRSPTYLFQAEWIQGGRHASLNPQTRHLCLSHR